MAGDKYLEHDGAGGAIEKVTPQASAGVGDAGKIAALDAAGKWDTSMMPTGIGADTASIVTSEDVAAGDYINIYDVTGTATCRKADATTAGKRAYGFVLAAALSGANATVYFEGSNDQVTGQTAGEVFLSTTPGLGTSTAPSTTGNIVQSIGIATSATSVNFEAAKPITLA